MEKEDKQSKDPDQKIGHPRICGVPSCKNPLDDFDCHSSCLIHRACISKSSLSFRPGKCDDCEQLVSEDDPLFFQKMHDVVSAWRMLNHRETNIGIQERLTQRNYLTPFLSKTELAEQLRKRHREDRHVMVMLESLVSGYQKPFVKPRGTDKHECIAYDPWIKQDSVFREKKKIRSLRSTKYVK